jgi:CMP-2-keto-3-deoxyoctulosonic acid synthetase
MRIVIPARYASTLLPGKPLLELAGKPMLQHVYERAMASHAVEVVVATDDERIAGWRMALGPVSVSPTRPTPVARNGLPK